MTASIKAVAERLRESKRAAAVAAEVIELTRVNPRSAGLAAGREWASQTATWAELEKISGLYAAAMEAIRLAFDGQPNPTPGMALIRYTEQFAPPAQVGPTISPVYLEAFAQAASEVHAAVRALV